MRHTRSHLHPVGVSIDLKCSVANNRYEIFLTSHMPPITRRRFLNAIKPVDLSHLPLLCEIRKKQRDHHLKLYIRRLSKYLVLSLSLLSFVDTKNSIVVSENKEIHVQDNIMIRQLFYCNATVLFF